MTKKEKIFFVILLLLPVVSSLLSTIHIIDLFGLGNPFSMSIAGAITIEIGSLVSFLLSGGNILPRESSSKRWLMFIFILLFFIQALGNVYSGFDYMTKQLIIDSTWLNTFMEMCFNAFTLTETKMILSAIIGLPLPIISLVMLKFALDKSTMNSIENKINEEETVKEMVEEDTDKKKENSDEEEIKEMIQEVEDEITEDDINNFEGIEEEQDEIEDNIELQQVESNDDMKEIDDDFSVFDEFYSGKQFNEEKTNQVIDTKSDVKQNIQEHKKPQGYDISKKNFIN